MKKLTIYILIILIILTLTIICPNKSYCANKTQNAEISKIENDIFGFEYSKDDIKKRVERLEKNIYGKTSSGDLLQRLKKLASDVNADLIGLEIEPVEDTFAEKETIADNTVDYPIVNEIEKKLFNKTYKERDFHTRIVTIERKLFGKIYDVEDYSTRMDRIKSKVMPETIVQSQQNDIYGRDEYTLTQSDLSGLNSSRYSGMFGQKNYTRPYANYGNYGNAITQSPPNMNEELAQLEYDTFGTEFTNEDTKTRIKRLNSVNKAKKSAPKYDSQKFQQRMSTAMEIGAMILMILAMVL